MNPTTIKNIAIGTIVAGDNPRLPTNLMLESLAENIEAVGLLEPLHVWYPSPEQDIAELIRGHRRGGALNLLAEFNPMRFAELFPEGIPVIVWEGITAEEALMLKLDHGGQVTLSDPHELQMSATLMFDKNFTEAQVANHLKPLITRLSPMPAKAAKEVKELETALTEAQNGGDVTKVDAAETALTDRIAKLYRGRVQNLHNVARSPELVNAALYFKACGEKLKSYEDTVLPRLTTDQVKALWNAHKLDLEIMGDNGAPKFNKRVVGPNFTSKWNGLVVKEAEAVAEGPKAPREKAMAAKDMKSELTEGKWLSVGFYKLTRHHTGDKTVEGLAELDKAYHAVDLVNQYDPKLLKRLMASAEKIEATLRSESAEGESTEG